MEYRRSPVDKYGLVAAFAIWISLIHPLMIVLAAQLTPIWNLNLGGFVPFYVPGNLFAIRFFTKPIVRLLPTIFRKHPPSFEEWAAAAACYFKHCGARCSNGPFGLVAVFCFAHRGGGLFVCHVLFGYLGYPPGWRRIRSS
jgi:hypothetical protein